MIRRDGRLIDSPAHALFTAVLRNSHDTASVSPITEVIPMSRFALVAVALIVVVAIGSENRHAGSLTKSMESMCVCIPARAGLIMKSAIARTPPRSLQLLAA